MCDCDNSGIPDNVNEYDEYGNMVLSPIQSERLHRALEQIKDMQTPGLFPQCPLVTWLIHNFLLSVITGSDDCDVQALLRELLHLDDLKPKLHELYYTLIRAIVPKQPEYTGPGADYVSSNPDPDQIYTLSPGQVLLLEGQCAAIASRKFIDFLNRYGTQCMMFECYRSNTPFLIETCLAVLYAEWTRNEYAFQFYILMASLNTPQPGAFPCTEIIFVAMGTPEFEAMVTSTPDWMQKLKKGGFLFLSGVLFDSLELSSLPHDARTTYFTLVNRIVVKKKVVTLHKIHPLMPHIKDPPTFTLSSTSPQVDNGDRIALPPKEALIMVSQGFIACIQKHWSEHVSHPWYGKNLNVAMMHLWDDYHSLCLLEPRGE